MHVDHRWEWSTGVDCLCIQMDTAAGRRHIDHWFLPGLVALEEGDHAGWWPFSLCFMHCALRIFNRQNVMQEGKWHKQTSVHLVLLPQLLLLLLCSVQHWWLLVSFTAHNRGFADEPLAVPPLPGHSTSLLAFPGSSGAKVTGGLRKEVLPWGLKTQWQQRTENLLGSHFWLSSGSQVGVLQTSFACFGNKDFLGFYI
jgi:hypothetical protein